MLYLFGIMKKKIHFLKKTLMLKIKIKNICFGPIVYSIFLYNFLFWYSCLFYILIQFSIISFISQNLTPSCKKQQVL